MADSSILTEAKGGVWVITLNRPDARNAVDKTLAAEMAAALEKLDADPALKVGVLVGAGKGFSAGMDLKAFVSGGLPTAGDRGFAGIAERAAKKPLIAAVEGFALAGGLEIALSCDLIVAAKNARLGIPEVGVGLFAGAGALLRLPRRVGLGNSMRLALTGQPIDGEEGHRIGLVDKLAEPGQALAAAIELAEVIAKNAPLGVAGSKRVLVEGFTKPEDEFWKWQQSILEKVFTSKDAIEGATAFAEKRPPNWKGE